jgi:hypothetical protein
VIAISGRAFSRSTCASAVTRRKTTGATIWLLLLPFDKPRAAVPRGTAPRGISGREFKIAGHPPCPPWSRRRR